MNDTLRKQLIATYNLGDLPKDDQDDVLNKISELIYQAVLLRALPLLSDKQQDEFEKLLDNDAEPEELMAFFSKNVPGFEAIVKEEVEKFYKQAMQILG